MHTAQQNHVLDFGTVVALVVHEFSSLVVRPERGISGYIAALHRKIDASPRFVVQRLRCRSQQNQRLGMPSQPAIWKACVPAQPTQCAQQGMIIRFAHLHSLPDRKQVRQKPSMLRATNSLLAQNFAE
jgi:hypothetical protein